VIENCSKEIDMICTMVFCVSAAGSFVGSLSSSHHIASTIQTTTTQIIFEAQALTSNNASNILLPPKICSDGYKPHPHQRTMKRTREQGNRDVSRPSKASTPEVFDLG